MTDWLDAPLHLDGRGRSALVDDDGHISDLVRAVLFTEPGERVNRPEFGCPLRSLLFMPADEVVAGAIATLIRAALQRWLEREIRVEAVTVEAHESTLAVTVTYLRADTGEMRRDTFERRTDTP